MLLVTKLFVPRLHPGVIARPRLTERLRESLRSPLLLVSAGAGFGKTTLLADWSQSAANSDLSLGWLSLDQEDSDPARFWTYFIAALQTVLPEFGEDVLPLLRSAQPPPASVFLPPLINELAALTKDVTLVLDDYHLIDSPPVHEAIAFLIDRMPPRLHLAILTRADPPLPLARWRARGVLSELRAGDLRFTHDEVARYLRDAAGLSLSTDVSVLEARTEGWIVGLQMAAISLQGRADVAEFVRSFAGTNRYILEFLVEEVLNRQPEEVQEFLLQTSILEQLATGLCDAVLGRRGAGDLLERLERANLFLVPLDEDRSWYRYHHLFAELLRARLRQTRPDLVPELCRRAGEWCEKEGLIGEAMGYHLTAGDQERAAQLAEQSCLEMIRRSDPRFANMLAKLPDEVIRRRPWLAAYRAIRDVVWGRWDSAKTLLGEAERSVQLDDLLPDSGGLIPFIRLTSSYIAELEGAEADVPELAEAALAATPKSKHALWNTFGHWLGMSLFLRGNFQGAEDVWMRSVQEDLQTGSTNALAGNLVAIVRLRATQGRLRVASELCRQWLRWMDERGRWRFFRAGDLSISLGEIQREWNDLREALTLVEQGIVETQSWSTANYLASSYVAKARVLAAMGQIEPALVTLEELDGLLSGLSILPDLRSELDACRVNLHIAVRDLPAAARWVDDGLLSDNCRLTFRRERDAISLARLLLASGEHGKALALLARVEGAARLGGRAGRVIEVLTLQARALHAKNEVARALSVLGQALTLGEPEGYVRVFVDEGEPIADLLGRLDGLPAAPRQTTRFSPEYVARLLAAFDPQSRPSSSIPPSVGKRALPPSASDDAPLLTSAPPPLVEPLSERELEVLRLMATGLQNRQIAAKLVVAPGTVKAHVHNICGKLGAENRVHAIARATELQLL